MGLPRFPSPAYGGFLNPAEKNLHSLFEAITAPMKMPCGNTEALRKYENEQQIADRAPVELPDFSEEDWAHDAFGPKQAKAMAELFSLRDQYMTGPISPEVKAFLTVIRKIELAAYSEVMDR